MLSKIEEFRENIMEDPSALDKTHNGDDKMVKVEFMANSIEMNLKDKVGLEDFNPCEAVVHDEIDQLDDHKTRGGDVYSSDDPPVSISETNCKCTLIFIDLSYFKYLFCPFFSFQMSLKLKQKWCQKTKR